MEVWKDIKGYECFYEISNFGRVKSLDRVRICKNKAKKLYKGKILKGHVNNLGYLCFDLFDKNNVRKNIKGHFLVAFHFCKGYKSNFVVNHKNGIKHDNRSVNLEWVSFKENVRHAFKTGLVKREGFLILDLNNGIYFDSIGEAYRSYNFLFSLSHFKNMISNKKQNTTTLAKV